MKIKVNTTNRVLFCTTATLLVGIVIWFLVVSPTRKPITEQELAESLKGKSIDEIRSMLGDPDEVKPPQPLDPTEVWIYHGAYKYPIAIYFNEDGKVQVA